MSSRHCNRSLAFRLLAYGARQILLCAISSPAFACVGQEFRAACQFPAARQWEKVVVLEDVFSNRDLRRATKGHFQFVDIEIKPSKEPLYLVLWSRNDAIWRFHGATEMISRVIGFGREGAGGALPGYAALGVLGVERSKVHFVKPIKGAYSNEVFRIGPTKTCDGVTQACTPEDYYFYFPASVENPVAVSRHIQYGVSPEDDRDLINFKARPAGPLSLNFFREPEWVIHRDESQPTDSVVRFVPVQEASKIYGNDVEFEKIVSPPISLNDSLTRSR